MAAVREAKLRAVMEGGRVNGGLERMGCVCVCVLVQRAWAKGVGKGFWRSVLTLGAKKQDRRRERPGTTKTTK